MTIAISGKVKLNRIMMKDNFAYVAFSTAEHVKYNDVDEWRYSNWFGKFVGNAFQQLAGMDEGDWIVLPAPQDGKPPAARLSNVPKDVPAGVDIKEFNRNNPFAVVFDFDLAPQKEATKPDKSANPYA